MTGPKEGEERVTLDLLTKKMDDFARERDWERFHSPRNLLLALVITPIENPVFSFHYLFMMFL